MSDFTAPLEVRHLGSDLWATTREMSFFRQPGDARITVPAGFVTDFASIPRPLWPVVGHPAGEYVQAAVLHDYLYATGCTSRAVADAIFLEAMAVLGVAWWRRRVIHLGVRLFGVLPWAAHRQRGAVRERKNNLC